MALSEEKLREYSKRLYLSKMRLLLNNGFYGLLLMHMIITIDETCETAATDGTRIYFGPDFMDNLSDSELDFIMMHEVLHVALRHCARQGDRDNLQFNIACDIVVNSNIMHSCNDDPKSITTKKYGESMHLAPGGKEGYKFSAEEVYSMLAPQKTIQMNQISDPATGNGDGGDDGKNGALGIEGKGDDDKDGKNGTLGIAGKGDDDDNPGDKQGAFSSSPKQGRGEKRETKANTNGSWDDHSRWEATEDDSVMREVWVKRITDAAEAISIQEASNQRGRLPAFAQRLIKDLKEPQTDWRTILIDFLQEEVCDYSFSPPDRRYDESPFFLPDFNDTETVVSDILFMIDTSASMSDDMITAAYSEVKGAIDQFNGKLAGWLGFFDAAIIEPQPFSDESEFKIIKPAGGGGTDFHIIFEYVHFNMHDNPPCCIVILTDGFAPFPDQSITEDIPVLWLINNEEVIPPWGSVARIKV